METVFIDTHVVVWLFQKNVEKFSPAAMQLIESCELVVPAIVVMELGLLHEIKRLNFTPQNILQELRQTIGLKVSDSAFEAVAYASLPLDWTCDPFDRLIAADASLHGARLLTKDKTIREHFNDAVW